MLCRTYGDDSLKGTFAVVINPFRTLYSKKSEESLQEEFLSMKLSKLPKIFLSVNLIALSFVCFQTAMAQTKANPQTVTDYFMLLPKAHLSLLQFAGKNRKDLIQQEDTKNGFLGLSSEQSEGAAQIALFRKKNREAVIAVSEFDCAPACSGGLKLLQYKSGKWSEATAQLLPEIDDHEILAAYNRIKTKGDDAHDESDMPFTTWELPQKGTTLRLVLGDASDSSGKTLMSFAWNGERFARVGK